MNSLVRKQNDLHRQIELAALVGRAFHALRSSPPEWKWKYLTPKRANSFLCQIFQAFFPGVNRVPSISAAIKVLFCQSIKKLRFLSVTKLQKCGGTKFATGFLWAQEFVWSKSSHLNFGCSVLEKERKKRERGSHAVAAHTKYSVKRFITDSTLG